MATNPQTGAFTGRTRDRKPKASVKVVDRLARSVITIGGLGSIMAVSMVGVFLVWVAAPLFKAPSLGDGVSFASDFAIPENGVSDLIPNEYLTMAWTWRGDSQFDVRSLVDGALLETRRLPLDAAPTARARGGDDGQVVLGFADGTVRLGRIAFTTTFLEADDLTAAQHSLEPGQAAPYRNGMIEKTPEGQYRFQELDIAFDEAVALAPAPITALDMSIRPGGPVVAALDSTGTVSLRAAKQRRNLLTGETTTRLRGGEVVLDEVARRGAPRWFLLNGQGDNVFAAWTDGRLVRVNSGDIRNPVVAETLDMILPGAPALTSLGFQIGKSSLVVGDAEGGLDVWFRIRPDDAATTDGLSMVHAKTLARGSAPVTITAASARSRMIAAGYADGTVRLHHVTNERLLTERAGDDDTPVVGLALSPRDDALLVATTAGLALQHIDAPHPEASIGALITPIWYEGYDEPAQVWQSSGGTDDFEPKYGLMPLIFGTLKATFYTMLFGLPLALLAAVFTSEFLEPRVKARVKPAIEMMASLPSVVLGFLAALVFAPFLENRVPEVLTGVVTVPAALLLGAHLWQLLPGDAAIRLSRWRLPAMFVMLPLGMLTAGAMGGLVEDHLFAGDIKAWLDGQIGNGAAGWMFLLLPVSAIAAGWSVDRFVNPWLRGLAGNWSRQRFAAFDLLKFAVSLVATVGIALMTAEVLSAVGLDPRGSFVGTYVQRNALIVGFVMGFAVIPIIYTIAEDALSAVPEHLRAASLGAGATPWQTAVRVIIPPAMSGLFSATMIGLGRAVGETMIVLMAAGNTPIMDGNIFNGFRTLSANIAVELPEAVQNSTHFRTLFLAALALFAMTFVLNTAAEIVRMRFRKKAYQL